jgi:hypothetical protein
MNSQATSLAVIVLKQGRDIVRFPSRSTTTITMLYLLLSVGNSWKSIEISCYGYSGIGSGCNRSGVLSLGTVDLQQVLQFRTNWSTSDTRPGQ